MLKVANIIEEGRYGGPQATILAVAERLNRRGIQTIVIFPSNDSDLFHQKLTNNGIHSRRLDLRRLTRQKAHLIKYFFFFIREVFGLVSMIKQEDVDIVQCNDVRQVKGLISGQLARKKVVWLLNNTNPPRIMFWLFSVLWRYCDGFILTGRRVENYYLTNSRLRAVPHIIIRPPVDVKRFNPERVLKRRNILIKKSNVGLNIVTIANINPVKGLEYFIEMAHILNKRDKRANFFIVGPHLESQKKYSMSLIGLIKQYEIEDIQFTGASYESIPFLVEIP